MRGRVGIPCKARLVGVKEYTSTRARGLLPRASLEEIQRTSKLVAVGAKPLSWYSTSPSRAHT